MKAQIVSFALFFSIANFVLGQGQIYCNDLPGLIDETNCTPSAIMCNNPFIDACYDFYIIKGIKYSTAPSFGFTKGDCESNSGNCEDLYVDIYVPCYNNSNKPAVAFTGGGGFVDGQKGRTNKRTQQLCAYFAQRGYMSFAFGYRSYNPEDSISIYDPDLLCNLGPGSTFSQFVACLEIEYNSIEIIRNARSEMALKTSQDGRAVLKFIWSNASLFNIDPNKIFIGGSSSGGTVAIQSAYIDNLNDITLISSNTNDLCGMFGSLDEYGGSTDLLPNYVPAGIINLWGKIGNPEWMDHDESPIITFQGTFDNAGYQVKTLNDQYGSIINPNPVLSFGGEAIVCRAAEIEIPFEMHSFHRAPHSLYSTPQGSCDFDTSYSPYGSFILERSSMFMKKCIDSIPSDYQYIRNYPWIGPPGGKPVSCMYDVPVNLDADCIGDTTFCNIVGHHSYSAGDSLMLEDFNCDYIKEIVWCKKQNPEPCSAFQLIVDRDCNWTEANNTFAFPKKYSIPAVNQYFPGPYCAKGIYSSSVWFWVEMPYSNKIIIETNAIDFVDGGMEIYTGSCDKLKFVKCIDDVQGSKMPSFQLNGSAYGIKPFQKVFIRIWNKPPAPKGRFSLCIYEYAAPANDDCQNAAVVNVFTTKQWQRFSTLNATYSHTSPISCGSWQKRDVWLKIPMPVSKEITIFTAPYSGNVCYNPDGAMMIFSGSCSGVLNFLTCNDDYNGSVMPVLSIDHTSGIAPGEFVYVKYWERNFNDGEFLIAVIDSSITKKSNPDEFPLQEDIEWTVFPNPATDILSVQVRSQFRNISEITIYNYFGKKYFYKKIEKNTSGMIKVQIPLSTFTPGAYFISLKTDSGLVYKRFVKQ